MYKPEPDVNDMNLLVTAYTKLRDKHDRIGDEAKKKQAELKEKMKILSLHMLNLMGTATAVRTDAATVTRVVKQKFWASDWEAFKKYLQETDNLGLIENRIAQRNMAQFLESNPDTIPPGLEMDRRYDILVRKLPKKPQ